jgi:hypothetical protein
VAPTVVLAGPGVPGAAGMPNPAGEAGFWDSEGAGGALAWGAEAG